MRDALVTAFGQQGLPTALAESHPNVFSAFPVYVSRSHIAQIADVVNAVEAAVRLRQYRDTVLSWAPDIAKFDPGSPGGLLGFDFHLSPQGPKLIEINTNPGGVLLNALMGQAQRLCMPEVVDSPTDLVAAEQRVLDVLLDEWALSRGRRVLTSVAIVDEVPEKQYLYPEFLLFRELFLRNGIHAKICDPQELAYDAGHLALGGATIDLVYNRLTDFGLDETQHEVLRTAYLERCVVLTPHPRAHALYADKRNLVLLGNRDFLQDAGLDSRTADVLAAAVPRTLVMTPENRDELWQQRRHLFFKPSAGFGSKASYRGDKLTRRVWEEMNSRPYIAQELVPPSERRIGHDQAPLKADIRCYAYRGKPLLYAARLYQGQTTNFRTPGGGFAPVLTAAE